LANIIFFKSKIKNYCEGKEDWGGFSWLFGWGVFGFLVGRLVGWLVSKLLGSWLG